MTVGIVAAGFFMKDPPKNWWPKEIDPLNWQKHSTRDLRNNPPALRHYNLGEMWRTPQAKWIGIQYALFIGCSLFGVAYYYAVRQGDGPRAAWRRWPASPASRSRDGLARPVYGYISEFIGRRKTMIYAYSGNVVFQLLAYFAGAHHNAPLFVICAIISGGLSGANFPMTAALVADYYGETNNAINYGSIYAFKALGGSFAGGVAALIMTGTLYGTAHFHWVLRLLLRRRARCAGRADGRASCASGRPWSRWNGRACASRGERRRRSATKAKPADRLIGARHGAHGP